MTVVIVVINLMDEAKKKNINIDLKKLSQILKVPVIRTSATYNKGITNLKEIIANKCQKKNKSN